MKKIKFADLLREHNLLNNPIEESSEIQRLEDLMVNAGVSKKPISVTELLQEAGISNKLKPEEVLQEVSRKDVVMESKSLLNLLDDAGIPTLNIQYEDEIINSEIEAQIEDEVEEDIIIIPKEKIVSPIQEVEEAEEAEEDEEFDPEKELIKRFDSVVKGENKEFDSSWILRSNFSSVVLGSDLKSDVNSDVIHNLNTPYHDLDIKVLVKLSDSKSKKEYQCELQKYMTPDCKYGINVAPISSDILRVNTGSEGIMLYIAKQDGSIEKRIISKVSDYKVYYRIIVRRAFSMDSSQVLTRGGGYTSSIPVGIQGEAGLPGPPGPPGPPGAGSGADLIVQELDGYPIGTGISVLKFNQDHPSNTVYVDGNTAIIGAPGNAPSIDGSNLTLGGAIQYAGRLSLNNINYETGIADAGDSTTYIQNDTVFSLSSQLDSSFGDKGVIKLYINGELSAAIDLASNFNESNRSTQQLLTDYNISYVEGSTFTLINGVCNFIGSYSGLGSLEIIKVEKYNNFEYWQSFQIAINISGQLRKGYSNMYLKHTIPLQVDKLTSSFKFFYDNDVGINPNINIPSIDEAVPVFNWLSGVKYYGNGSTFNLDFVAQDVFDNVYHDSNAPATISGWPGMTVTGILYNDISVSGVSVPPDINESMSVNDYIFTQASNQSSDNARITVTPRDPYGNYTPQQSVPGKWLIHSYASPSDDLNEYFRDEDYRMLWNEGMQDWDMPPSNKTGNWDSTQSLVVYDSGHRHLQCFLSKLIYPTINFSAGYFPTGNPNYSAFTGSLKPSFSQFAGNDVGVFVRGFYNDNQNHTSGRLYITGITGTHMTNLNIEVFIKVPGKTGWCALNKLYNAADYTGADGDGCRTNPGTYNGPVFEFTLGANFTDATTKWGIVVMVVMNPSSPQVSGRMYINNW